MKTTERLEFVVVLSALFFSAQCRAIDLNAEGTLGWSTYSGNFASDPVQACEIILRYFWGNNLISMRPHVEKALPFSTPIYECWSYGFGLPKVPMWQAPTALFCHVGYHAVWPGICVKRTEPPLPASCEPGRPGNTVANPVIVSSGMKLQQEEDFPGTASGTLRILRTYRIGRYSGAAQSAGQAWSFSFDGEFYVSLDGHHKPNRVYGTSGDGSNFDFSVQRNGDFVSNRDNRQFIVPLNPDFSEWLLKYSNGKAEKYSKSGGMFRLQSTHWAYGASEQYHYDQNGRLQSIEDNQGRSLRITWAGDYVDSISNGSSVVNYKYKQFEWSSGASVEGLNQLWEVESQDNQGNILLKRTYHYEDPNNPFLLTGVTDGNGMRFATYQYDSSAQVVVSEHAGGADHFEINYQSPTTRVVTDPLGTRRVIQLVNPPDNSGGRVTSVSQPAGSGCMASNKTLGYDRNYNLSSTVDFNGNKTCYTRTAQRGLETARIEGLSSNAICPSVTSPLPKGARKISTQWHPDWELKTKISSPSKSVTLLYNGQPDELGRIADCAQGGVLPDGRPLSVLCEQIVQQTSDSNGSQGFNAVRIGQPRTWRYEYDEKGKPTRKSAPPNAAGVAETFKYSYYATDDSMHKRDDLELVTDGAGSITKFIAYNDDGLATQIQLPTGQMMFLQFDSSQQLRESKLVAPNGLEETTTFSYDQAGLLTQIISPNGAVKRLTYDGAHRLIAIGDSTGNRIHFLLDAAGNILKRRLVDNTGNLLYELKFNFDALGRLQQVLNESSGPRTLRYDANGNISSIIDAMQRVQSWQYDRFDRMTRHELPASNSDSPMPAISYFYNHQNLLTAVTDPRGLTTNYIYNGFGENEELQSPDTGITHYQYNLQGVLTQKRDNNAHTVNYQYDAAGRLIQAGRATFEYGQTGSSTGLLIGIADDSGSTTFTYNSFSQLQSKTQRLQIGADSKTFNVTYDYGNDGNARGRKTALIYPSLHRIEFDYDEEGRVHDVNLLLPGDPRKVSVVSQIEYVPFGPIRNWTWRASGQFYGRTFDEAGRLKSYPLGSLNAGGSIRTLQYDALGHISAYTHSGNIKSSMLDQQFGYDELERLISFASSSTSEVFTYDLSGNRTTTRFGRSYYLNTISASSNRLLQTTGPVPAQSNIYDLTGNLVSDGNIKFEYDKEGRLAVARNGSITAYYRYNGVGQRVSKIAVPGNLVTPLNLVLSRNADVTYYIYDEAGHLLGEYDRSGKPIQEIIYLGDLPIAILRKNDQQENKTDVFNVYADHLNTPRVISRSTDGKIVWRWDMSDPFGLLPPDEMPIGAGKFKFNLRFPGQYYDEESNLHYNYFRDYDPRSGRYYESDPIGLMGGINTYVFVEGNPVNKIDPKGLQVPKGALDLRDVVTHMIPHDAVPRPPTREKLECMKKYVNDHYGATGSFIVPNFSAFSLIDNGSNMVEGGGKGNLEATIEHGGEKLSALSVLGEGGKFAQSAAVTSEAIGTGSSASLAIFRTGTAMRAAAAGAEGIAEAAGVPFFYWATYVNHLAAEACGCQ